MQDVINIDFLPFAISFSIFENKYKVISTMLYQTRTFSRCTFIANRVKIVIKIQNSNRSHKAHEPEIVK